MNEIQADVLVKALVHDNGDVVSSAGLVFFYFRYVIILFPFLLTWLSECSKKLLYSDTKCDGKKIRQSVIKKCLHNSEHVEV